MATYAIGDVQGRDEALGELLDKIGFSADRDRLWLTGDLVNRGPQSLATLRRVRALGDNVSVVLGNHDMHLLAVAFGGAPMRKQDTLTDVLSAPDRRSLLGWLLQLPFLVEDAALRTAMLHAGLPPQWDWATARACAREVETALRADPENFVAQLYGDEPCVWRDELSGAERRRFIVNCFTRLRYVDERGALELENKDSPAKNRNARLLPWYEAAGAWRHGAHVIFGHWSSLGFYRDDNVTCLDTGCAWGQALTALRIDVAHTTEISVDCRN